MWLYKSVSREEFESRKDFVDKILQEFGCEVLTAELPYEQKMTTYGGGFEDTWISERPLYRYGERYFRIAEILFREAPFIVIECADAMDEVMKNIMEDADPFPYDLSDAETISEIKYVLGIEPYPGTENSPG